VFDDRMKEKYLVCRWNIEEGENYIKRNSTI
jgi:hypothetical protein